MPADAPAPAIELTDDDRLFLHAIAMAGDAVREADVEYLLARWPWSCPMDWASVERLEEAGMLARTDDGWFVPYAVEAEVSASLPEALDRPLRGFVGEMLCRGADSLDRFRLGFRRMLAGGREHAVASVCRAWAAQPVGLAGPRGRRFVEALGSTRLPRGLQVQLAAAVPELARPLRWEAPLRRLRAGIGRPAGLTAAASTAAALALLLIDLLRRAGSDVERLAQR